jgi:2,3-bisphosphoglycerate-dependent phosphoglycerate mutase
MTSLILIRHGQSQWNLENRFTGWYDAELTELGQKEAKKAGELIQKLNLNFAYAFTSFQKRAINTLNILLKESKINVPTIVKAWQLNERHYGGLQGLNKSETEQKHGKEQVMIWRRSYDTRPPLLDRSDPNHPVNNDIYKSIDPNVIPDGESLKDTYNRSVPYFDKEIAPKLLKDNILISAHGNSLRALCKKLFNISDAMIIKLEIPTGNPMQITLNSSLEVMKAEYLDSTRAKEIILNQ